VPPPIGDYAEIGDCRSAPRVATQDQPIIMRIAILSLEPHTCVERRLPEIHGEVRSHDEHR
jgi:hypothetical protein